MLNEVSKPSIGYWGPITSSVDWCEENYTHSYYIAEFWNSISSLAMVALGLLGILLHHKTLGWRLSTSYLLIVIVGIGSVLFHATLKFENQMWDEVPMVWTACYLFWVLLEEHGYQQQTTASAIVIAAYCAIATYVTSANKGSTQFYMFQSSFGLVMWSDLYFVYKIYKHVSNEKVKQLFHSGVKFLLAAISVWLFDSNLCFVFNHLPNPQLHAWWHILMCTSLHYFFVACGHESMIRQKRVPVIRYFLNLIPYIDTKDK